MPDLYDQHDPLSDIDRVDDSVVALAHTVAVTAPGELLTSGRPRLFCQKSNPGNYAPAISLPADRFYLLHS
jgi:hypothetical protein